MCRSKNFWRRPWSFRIFPHAFICQTQAPRVRIVKDDYTWPILTQGMFWFKKNPSHYHPLSWYNHPHHFSNFNIWQKPCLLLRGRFRCCPLIKHVWETQRVWVVKDDVFFIGRRVMEQRLLNFVFFLDSLRFQMFISNLFLETSLGSKGLFLARFTVAMPWAAKTCAADVIVFSWSLCNAKPRLHLNQGSVFGCVGWAVGRNCKCWANQIPRNWICCEWDSGNFRWWFMASNAFGFRVQLAIQKPSVTWAVSQLESCEVRETTRLVGWRECKPGADCSRWQVL